MKAKIISAFPGTGKSYLFNETSIQRIADSDSSHFSWLVDGSRNPNFASDYVDYIKSLSLEKDLILISTHKEIREQLVKENISFTLIYPNLNCKKEYLDRYRKRGSSETFLKFMENNWEDFLKELSEQKSCSHLILKEGQYLSDIVYKC